MRRTGLLVLGLMVWCLAGSAGEPAPGVEWVLSKPAKLEFTKSEITVAQYRACVKAGKCTESKDRKDDKSCNWGYADRDRHPVNCIDWHQAKAVCAWAGGRLPTEQEWEAEASDKGSRKYPWGDEKLSCDRAIWTQTEGARGCGRDSTWPVCSKAKGNSVSGLCDMAGNVWEWTSSTVEHKFDSLDDGKKDRRVGRGGSWFGFGGGSEFLHADLGIRHLASFWTYDLGVRCVRDVK